MGANQNLVITGEELAHGANLGWIDALFITGGLARGETGTSGQPDPEKLAAYLDEAQLSARWSIGYLR